MRMAQNDYDGVEFDMDFHVEFPTSCPSSTFKVIWPTDGIQAVNNEEDKQVLIILLGWAGARDKYLAKYSDFYLNRGCIILRYITPIPALVIHQDRIPLLARRFVKLLRDFDLMAHPTFFHVFSNGGSFMYSNIVKAGACEQDSDKFNFKGVIFDSAPAPRNLVACFRALCNIFSGFKIFRYVLAAGVIFWLVLLAFTHHLRMAFQFCVYGEQVKSPASIKSIVPVDPLEDWLTRIRSIRRHAFAFIYSDQDDLIQSNQVEQTAQILKERGNLVSMIKFEGSQHVQHYRAYPEEYISEVTKFIRATMAKEYGPPIFWDEAN